MSEDKWDLAFTKAAIKDIAGLKEPRKSHVYKALQKVRQNPLPRGEGGYGEPLGHHNSGNLTGLLKIKLRSDGIRVVYRLERADRRMVVVIVGIRDDEAVYREAAKRL